MGDGVFLSQPLNRLYEGSGTPLTLNGEFCAIDIMALRCCVASRPQHQKRQTCQQHIGFSGGPIAAVVRADDEVIKAITVDVAKLQIGPTAGIVG